MLEIGNTEQQSEMNTLLPFFFWLWIGLVGAVTRIQDRVKIFLAVLFWMSLFFWVTVTDGRGKGKGKKGSRFK